MEDAIIIGSAIFFAVSSPVFFISPRIFFGMSFVARSVANLVVDVEIFSIGAYSFTFPDILAVFTLLFSLGYFGARLPALLASRLIRPAICFLLAFLFFAALAAFANGPDSLKEAAKVTSWLIYFPVGYALFSDSDGMRTLRRVGMATAIITIAGLGVGNIERVGDSAYDLGLIYLGFFASESVLASALVGSLALFLLPGPDGKTNGFVAAVNKLIVVLLLILIAAIMVRTAILGMFILFLIYSLLSSATGISRRFAAAAGVVILFSVIMTGLLLSNPDYIESRYKDVQVARDRGDATSLGSGRVSVFMKYFEEFRSKSALTQIFGADFFTNTDQSRSRTFRAAEIGTKPAEIGTHNDLLQILFLSGVVGCSFYAAMWISIGLAVRRTLKLPLNAKERRIVALAGGLVGLYSVWVFHGAIFNIFMMQAIAAGVGAGLGVRHPIVKVGSETVRYSNVSR